MRGYGYKGEEIAESLGIDPTAVIGYLRERQDFQDKMERLILLLNGFRNILYN